jgi:hypothetical protein
MTRIADLCRGSLASFDMEITFAPFDETSRKRITQLINKSNQFNLTTRRYMESEVAASECDSSCFAIQVRLADSFGDNGMISAVICRLRGAMEWGDRYLADELPGPWPKGRTDGAAGTFGACRAARNSRSARRPPSHESQQNGGRPLSRARIRSVRHGTRWGRLLEDSMLRPRRSNPRR